MIEFRHVSKRFPDGTTAVTDVDLVVPSRKTTVLVGSSGSGKTTLLRMVNRMVEPTSGSISIDGEDIADESPVALRRRIGYVMQNSGLMPHFTVADNIATVPRLVGRTRRAARERALELMEVVGLDAHMADRYPNQLSGGQQQRVALARAVATEPEVLLLDEPLSNLDARLRLEARTFLKELQRDLGVTTVFVTHDQAEALALADRIAVMKSGRLQQVGTPQEVFQRPTNTFVASFIGSSPINLVTTTIADGVASVGEGSVPLPEGVTVADGTEVIWGARPEYLRWSAEKVEPGVPVEVSVTENLGATALITAHSGEEKLQLVVPEEDAPTPGDRGWVLASARRSLLFDPETTHRID